MRVLIVGAGIAGLSLAGLLHRRGIETVVVEQVPAWREFGYAIGLWPNGMRVLKRLGVADAVRARGKQMHTYTIRDSSGERLRSFDLASISKPFGYNLQTHRAWLHEALLEAVPPETIRMGLTLAELVQTGSGVDVEFSDLSRDSFDLVVGADGFHSITRRLLFGSEGMDYSGVTVWCFWAPLDFDVPDELTDVWGSAGRYCSILPLPGRTAIHLAMGFDEPPRDPLETRVERVKERFENLPWVIGDAVRTLSDPKEIVTAHIYQVQLEQWHEGRVILIGDAAHAVHPSSGMGTSLALEDAAVLTEEIADMDPEHLDVALDRFVERRRERVDRIQREASQLALLVFNRYPPVQHLALTALKYIPGIEDVFHKATQEWLAPPF